jgi:hypothetical protein
VIYAKISARYNNRKVTDQGRSVGELSQPRYYRAFDSGAICKKLSELNYYYSGNGQDVFIEYETVDLDKIDEVYHRPLYDIGWNKIVQPIGNLCGPIEALMADQYDNPIRLSILSIVNNEIMESFSLRASTIGTELGIFLYYALVVHHKGNVYKVVSQCPIDNIDHKQAIRHILGTIGITGDLLEGDRPHSSNVLLTALAKELELVSPWPINNSELVRKLEL